MVQTASGSVGNLPKSVPQNRHWAKMQMGKHGARQRVGSTSIRAIWSRDNHDRENPIRNQSNTTILCDSHCKRSWPQERRRRRLSSVSNWFCSGHARQAGGSLGLRRRASRATLRSPQIPSQTDSCQQNMHYSLGGNQTHRHDPHHRPIEGASPVQRVTKSLTRVWAKISFDKRSGDLYITMQQLEFHIPTATDSRGQAASPR